MLSIGRYLHVKWALNIKIDDLHVKWALNIKIDDKAVFSWPNGCFYEKCDIVVGFS